MLSHSSPPHWLEAVTAPQGGNKGLGEAEVAPNSLALVQAQGKLPVSAKSQKPTNPRGTGAELFQPMTWKVCWPKFLYANVGLGYTSMETERSEMELIFHNFILK